MPGREDAWLQTRSGRAFHPWAPQPGDVVLADIVHALSNLCRWHGHTRVFYSVAEHSSRVHDVIISLHGQINLDLLRWALLHDATEAYVNDLASPLKWHLPEYRVVETRVRAAISARFGLTDSILPREVDYADRVMLATEARYLLGPPPKLWGTQLPPSLNLGDRPGLGWSPERAYREFSDRLFAAGVQP